MTQPWLHMRHKSTAHSQVAVYKDINRQLIQIGSDFGTDENTTTAGGSKLTSNRVIHWNNDLYALNGNNGIYKYIVESGVWNLEHAFAAPIGSNITSERLGFVASSLNGSGLVVCGYPVGTTTWRPVYIYGDGSIVEGSNVALQVDGWSPNFTNTASRLLYEPIAHRNYVYFMIQDTTFFTSFPLSRENINRLDLETGAVARIDDPSNRYGSWAGGLCIHNDKVFYIAMNNGQAGPVYVFRIDGTTMTLITTFVYDGGGNVPLDGNKQTLVSVEGKLFAFFSRGSDMYCWEIVLDELNNHVTNINRSATVLPAELRSGGSRFFNNNQYRFKVDTITDPENPEWYVDIQRGYTEGNPRLYYKWINAPTGQLQFIDAGLDAFRYDHINHTYTTGGENVWSGSGTINASAPQLQINGANIECKFTVYGVGQTGVKAQVVFDKDGEVPSTLGTIAATTSGTINGKQVEGLTANGNGEVIISWGASIDGISSGDNPRVAIRVFI